jgi:hypothetical protein
MQLPVMIHVQTLQHGIYSNADFPCQTTRYQNCFLTIGTDDNIVIPLHDHFFVCVCVCVVIQELLISQCTGDRVTSNLLLAI